MENPTGRGSQARIEGVSVQNYRALRKVTLAPLSPLTVLLGPNGSGKSTVFDVFAFLSESFTVGLRKAWDHRNRFRELRSRGADGPIVFEVRYRERANTPIITYHLAIDERPAYGPYVAEEWLQWRRGSHGKPFQFLNFRNGEGEVISGEAPEQEDERIHEKLESPEVLAVNTLGQFAKHPRVSALRRFIAGWHLSYLTADNTRGVPEGGPQERLSQTGDNLRRRVPRLEKVDAELLADGRLLLQMKDAPFERPILAKYTSDGTLKMLAYLVALYDPMPPPLIGIEEPENHLHPRLLPELAEECRKATAGTQLMVTTHSPFFLDGLRPREVWVLYRDASGFANARRVADIPGVQEFVDSGASLGHLWMENHFRVGDPLTSAGEPTGPIGPAPSGEETGDAH
jgi:predicted ATPase